MEDKKAKSAPSPKLSRASSAGKSGNSKPAKGKKKLTIKDQLIAENNELKEELQKLGDENKALHEKLEVIVMKIVTNDDEGEDLEMEEGFEPCNLPTDDIMAMLQKIIKKSKTRKKHALEIRVEELETRVTHLTVELAKTSRAKIAFEHGLKATCLCPDMEQVRAKVEQVRLEVEGPHWTAPVYSTNQSNTTLHPMTYKSLSDSFSSGRHNVPFNPPRPKLPGDTHINQLIKELRLFLVRELSLEKASRADWRTMAERVGIPEDVIEEWEKLKLEYPMSKVFAEWSQSDSATVRLLHRHLVSPQMRCVLLAKRLDDYYQVT